MTSPYINYNVMQTSQVTPNELEQFKQVSNYYQGAGVQPAFPNSNDVQINYNNQLQNQASSIAGVFTNNPISYQTQSLQQASERKALALKLTDKRAELEDSTKRKMGISEDTIQRERAEANLFNSLSVQERIANYELYKDSQGKVGKPDSDLIIAEQTGDINYLRQRFGDEVADHFAQQHYVRARQSANANAHISNPSMFDSNANPFNIVGGVLKGVGSIANTVEDTWALALNAAGITSDEEFVQSVQKNAKHGVFHNLGELLQTKSFQHLDEASQLQSDLAEAYRKDLYNYYSQVLPEEEAVNKSSQEAEDTLLAMNLTSTQFIVNGLGEQLPQLIAGGVMAAIGKKVAAGATQTTIKQLLKQRVKGIKDEVAERIAKRATTKSSTDKIGGVLGIGTYTGLSEGMSAGSSVISTIMNIPLEVLKSTQGFKDLQKEYSTKSDEEIRSMLATEASNDARIKAGLVGAGIGTVLGQSELALAGIAKSATQGKALKDFVGNTLKEKAEEYSQERYSNYAANEGVNKAVKTDLVKDSDFGGHTQGTIAALTALGVSSAAKGGGVITEPIKAGLEKVADYQEKKIEEKAYKEASSVFGTSAGKDKEGNTIPAQKGVLGKTFDETNFGSVYKELEPVIQKEPSVALAMKEKGLKTSEYTRTMNLLYNAYIANKKELTKTDLTEEDKKIRTRLNQLHEGIFHQLEIGVQRDMVSVTEGAAEIEQQISDIFYSTTLKDSEKEAKAGILIDKLDSLIQGNEQLNELRGTKLFKILESDTRDDVKTQELGIDDVADISREKVASTSDIYFKIKTIQKDITKKKVKDAGTVKQELSKLITDYAIARSQSEMRKATNEDVAELRDLLGTAKQIIEQIDNVTLPILDEFVKAVDSISTTENELQQQVAMETFFGGFNGKRYNLGLLDYFADVLRNQGKMSKGYLEKMTNFRLAQSTKLAGVNMISHKLKNKKKDDTTSYTIADVLEGTAERISLSGAEIRFSDRNKAKSYYNAIAKHHAIFENIANTLVDQLVLKKRKPEASQVPQRQKQEQEKDITQDTVVNFSKASNKLLSNLAYRNFNYKGKRYKTVSHAYQTLKSGTFNQKVYSDTRRNPINNDKTKTDNSYHLKLMYDLVMQSFRANPNMVKTLLDTGTTSIVYKEGNQFWQENMSKILTAVREQLRKEQDESKTEDKPKNEKKEVKQEIPSVLNVSSYETGLGQQLSNLYPNRIQILDKTFPSVEHAIGYTKALFALYSNPEKTEIAKAAEFYEKDSYTKLNRAIALKHKDKNTHMSLSFTNYAEDFVEFLIEQMLMSNPKLLAKLQSQVRLGTKITHTYKGKAGSYEKAISNAISKFLYRNADGSYENIDTKVLRISEEDKVSKEDLDKTSNPIYQLIRNSSELASLEEDEAVYIDEYFTFEDLIHRLWENNNQGISALSSSKDVAKNKDNNKREEEEEEEKEKEKEKEKEGEDKRKSTDEEQDELFNEILGVGTYQKVRNQIVDNILPNLGDSWAKDAKYDTEDNAVTFTKSDGETVTVPMSLVYNLRAKGFSLDENLFDAVTEVTPPAHIITEESKAEDFNIVKDAATTNFLKGYNELYNYLKKFFTKSPRIFDKKVNVGKSPIYSVDGLLNFLEHNSETNEFTLEERMIRGMTSAQTIFIASAEQLVHTNEKQMIDYWTEDRGAYKWKISNVTRQTTYGKSSHVTDPVATDYSIADLGMVTNDLITFLGKTTLDQMGVKYKRDKDSQYSEEVQNGFEYSIGLALYNSMLQQGLLTVYNVDLLGKNDEVIGSIPYTNLKWNTTDNPFNEQETEALIAFRKAQGTRGHARVLNATSEALVPAARLAHTAHLPIFKTIFGEDTSDRANGVIMKNVDDIIGTKISEEQVEVSSKATDTAFGQRSSENLNVAIAEHNKVKYAFNMPLFNMVMKFPEQMAVAFGFVEDIENKPVSQNTIKATTSTNNAIKRSIGIIQKYADRALLQNIPLHKVIFQFTHKFVPNMRVMLDADLNPQNNKIIREVLRLWDFAAGKDGDTITGEMKFDIDIQGTKSRFKTDGEPRTIDTLIKVANGRKGKPKEFATGFLLALAQGLDISKLEKTYDENIFETVRRTFEEDELYQQTLDTVWEMTLATELNEEFTPADEQKEILAKFANKLGNGAPRAINAMQSLGLYMYGKTSKDRNPKRSNKFVTSLLLEADGIGNGLYNITRQFALRFTASYLDTLKRTGMIPLDVLSQIYHNEIRNGRRLKPSELKDKIQGSAHMFDKTGVDGAKREALQDVYEVIASKLAKEANNALEIVNQYAQSRKGTYQEDLDQLSTFEWLIAHVEIKKGKPVWKAQKEAQKEVQKAAKFLMQLELSGYIKSDYPIHATIYHPHDITLQGNTLHEIKRNLAKAGVTPTVYGGGLKGIANQLASNLKAQVTQMGDDILGLVHESIKNPSEETKQNLYTAIDKFNNHMNVYGISWHGGKTVDGTHPLKISVEQLRTAVMTRNFNNVRQIIDNALYKFDIQTESFVQGLNHGLAEKLQDAVQDTYVDEFSTLGYAMSHDDAGFTNFLLELEDKIQSAVQARNKRKGYAKTDPRQFEGLSRQEMKSLIRTIESAPVISTAFANDARLFEDALEFGNVLVKTTVRDKSNNITINDIYSTQAISDKGTPLKFYNSLSTQMFHNYRKYLAAGAANATYTIPSTESATQSFTMLAVRAVEAGASQLNVFDGLDGLIYRRKLLGELANKITHEIHLDTNVLEGFYDRFNRSGIDKVLNSHVLKNKFSEEFKVAVDSQVSIKDLFQALSPNINEIQYLLNVLALYSMRYQNIKLGSDYKTNADYKKSVNATVSTLNSLKSTLSTMLDQILTHSEPSKFKNIKMDLVEKISDTKNHYGLILNTSYTTFWEGMQNVYNDTSAKFADKVLESKALRFVEKEFAPVIINQFAGGNRGFFYNEGKFKQIAKRFIKFATKNDQDFFLKNDMRLTSTMLAEFFNSDEEILKRVKEYKDRIRPTIVPNSISSIATSSKTTTIKDIVNNTKGNLGSSAKVIFNAFTEMFGEDAVIYTSIDELVENAIKVNPSQTRETILEGYVASDGFFKMIGGKPYIYLELSDLVDSSSTLTHEVIHALNHAVFEVYFNLDYRQQMEDAKAILVDKSKVEIKIPRNLSQEEKAELRAEKQRQIQEKIQARNNARERLTALQRQHAAVNRLIELSFQYSRFRRHNSQVTELLEKNKSHPTDLLKQYAGLVHSADVSVANFLHAFEHIREDKQGNWQNVPEGWSVQDVMNLRKTVLQEFTAYLLSESDTVNTLAQVRDNSLMKKLQGFLDFFRKAKEAVLSFLGYSQDDIEKAPNSLLTSYLAVYHNLGLQGKLREVNQETELFHKRKRSSPVNNLNQSAEFIGEVTEIIDTIQANIPKIVKPVNIGTLEAPSYPKETKIISNAKKDNEINDAIVVLRKSGIPVTTFEENALQMLYAANKANFIDGANTDLLGEVNDWINALLTEIDPKAFPKGALGFNAMFNNPSIPQESRAGFILALATGNETINEYLVNLSKSNKKKTKVQQAVAAIKNKTVFKNTLSHLTNPSTIQKLAYASALFDFRNKATADEFFRRRDEEEAKEARVREILDTIDEYAQHSPLGIQQLLQLSTIGFTGLDLANDGSDSDSTLGQLIRKVIYANEELKGRTTNLGKLTSWLIGLDFSTQYIGKLKGMRTQMTEAIRERITAAIPLSIRRQFETRPSKEQEKLLDKHFVTKRLNRLAYVPKFSESVVGRLFEDETFIDYKIQETRQELWNTIIDSDKPYKQNEVFNYFIWQTQGLADYLHNRTAKTNDVTVAHGIESSAVAIARLDSEFFVFSADKRKFAPTGEENQKLFYNHIKALVALESLKRISKEDRKAFFELFEQDRHGFMTLIESGNIMDLELDHNHDSSFGDDSHVFAKRNPHKDIHVLLPSNFSYDNDLYAIREMGYEYKTTLPSGEEIYTTNDNIRNRFTTGVFGISEQTIRGVDAHTGYRNGAFINKDSSYTQESNELENKKQQMRKIVAKAVKDPKYYDKLETYTSRKFSRNYSNGSFYAEIPLDLENSLVETYETGIDAIGNAQGRLMEEYTTISENRKYVDYLRDHYNKSLHKERFIKIPTHHYRNTDDAAMDEYQNRLRSIYYTLPRDTREYIDRTGGLYIERHEIDNLLGYTQASITDIFTGKSGLPYPVQHAVQKVFDTFKGYTGKNLIIGVRRAERFISEITSLSKDFILNRSLTVAGYNLLSNVVHLWNAGVPVKDIPELMREGLTQAKRYNKDLNRFSEINYLIKSYSMPKEERTKLQAELTLLKNALDKNPVKPLVREGILTSVTALDIADEKDNNDFGYIAALQRKFKVDEFRQTEIGKVVSNVLVHEGSKTHDFMVNALDYGDFVAKYALYAHLTKKRQFTSERAMNVIRDEFINYNLNRGREFDWMNRVGLTWFLSYKLGIQKIIFRRLRRNFLRTSAVYAGYSAVGSNQAVPLQNLVWDSGIDYQTSPSNIIEGFSMHWLTNLLF